LGGLQGREKGDGKGCCGFDGFVELLSEGYAAPRGGGWYIEEQDFGAFSVGEVLKKEDQILG
jgi:hypothetical protein